MLCWQGLFFIAPQYIRFWDTTFRGLRRTIPLGDTTFRDYSSSLQGLNIDRLPFIPIRGPTFRGERRTIPFGDATFRSYSGTLRTLNGERLPFNSLRDLTVVERSAVLNGILQVPTLTPLH